MTLQYSSTLAVKALLLLAAFGMIYMLLTDSVKRRAARCRYDEAMEATQFEEPVRVVQLLLEAVRLDPDCADYHACLAFAYSTDRFAAANLLGISLPQLYDEVLKESAAACSLSPDNVDLARSYALWTLDARIFEASTDWDLAREAWTNYLVRHQQDTAKQVKNPANHVIETYAILARLSRIEMEMGNHEAADEKMHEALTLKMKEPIFSRSEYLQGYLQRGEVTGGDSDCD